jgi:hypothetical protein
MDIDIHLTKVVFKKLTLARDQKGHLQWEGAIALCTDCGMEIATYNVASKNYYGNKTVDVPAEVLFNAEDIIRKFTKAATYACISELKLLPEKTSSEDSVFTIEDAEYLEL